MSSPNAYQSPQPIMPIPKPGARQLDYMRMIMFVFDNPNWPMNLLWGALCILVASAIPVLPQLIFIGYTWVLIESWHRQGHDRYGDFDTSRFGDYLGRGAWPMLVSLLVVMVAVPVIMMVMFVGFIGVTSIAAAADQPALMFLNVFVILLLMVLFIGLNLFLTPMVIRAGLSQDFGQAFNFNWAWTFAKTMIWEMILGSLFLTAAGMVIGLGGMLLLCVGIYPAGALMMLAGAHFQWQLYEIFLERGGEPVPLKVQYLPPVQG